jgi:hypothetical protein
MADTQPESNEKALADALSGGVDEQQLIGLIHTRYTYMSDGDHYNRLRGMEDLKFTNEPGHQWDANMKQERGNRPCYEFNKIRITAKRIINDIRANRPTGKVRAVEGGDVENAEIYDGLIRNIWNTSKADNAIDYAAEYQVACGMGAWRIETEYSDDTAFEQDIRIGIVENPFCLYADPSCRDPLKRDAEDWIYTEKMPFKSYEKQYPNADRINFETIAEFDEDQDDWEDEQTVRIAEYWYKEPVDKELWMMDDGMVVDSTTDEAAAMLQDPAQMQRVQRKRMVKTHKIMSVVVSGRAILEGPTEWAGSRFPWVMVYGEHINLDGTKHWWGITRFAMDAQRSYNMARTAISETIAQTPKTKWWATAAQALGLTDQWAEAHKKNFPFMLYNADPKSPGPPARMGSADIPAALMAESELASQEIKEVTGIFDASMGRQGNEQSGRAIYARQQQGEIATFNYQDNIANGITLTYELLIDLIPNIYDSERELRILGSDGAEDYKRVNQVVYDPQTGKNVRINDLASGKYDAVVTIGPNFATQRQEAAETYGMLGQQFPELMSVAGDLVFKSMDLPYAEDIAERLRTILPPQIQQMLDSDKELPPEVQQAMQQAEQAMQQVQQHGQLVQAASQELEADKAMNEKQKAEIRTELANVARAKAEFDAHVAREMANLTKEQVGLITREAGIQVKGAELKKTATELATQEIAPLVNTADALTQVASMDEVLANFMTAVDGAMSSIEDKAAQHDISINRRPVGGGVSREGGRLTATVQFDDGSEKELNAVRDKGQLTIVPSDSETVGG